MNMVALIPARAGSRRIPGKNIKPLAGHPLIAWTIAAAKESGLFHRIVVSSDDREALAIAAEMGVRANLRRADLASDDAPDILWVREELSEQPDWNAFAILRPTSPFRAAETIRRAYQQFTRSEVHSIRAVEPVKQTPWKMWWLENGCLKPILRDDRFIDQAHLFTPNHSRPTQILPKAYVQNASLEMAWAYVVSSFGTISGTKIAPFFTQGYEGFDINDPEDWDCAEALVASGAVQLPHLPVPTPR